jgi:carbon storage regulator
MLVLTRRVGDGLMIGGGIEVTVLEIQGDKIKIGINAPKDVSILRKELVHEARDVNREAAMSEISLNMLAEAIKK